MNCEDLLTYLSDYLDNDLDDALAAEASQHVSTCQKCRVVLDTTRRTITLYREQPAATIAANDRARLFDALQAAFLARPNM